MRNGAPVPLGCSHLGETRHACAFFSDDDEAYRVLTPFIAEGFALGHKAIHIVRPDQEGRHLERLAEAGIDPAAARASGQLVLRHNTDTYLTNGQFDQDRMLAAFESLASGNATGDFPLSRIVCNMDWAADSHPSRESLIEFEARVNHIWSRHDDIVICVYDLAKFGGDFLVDIMRTHPMVLVGDILQENPFFTPPDEFLRERRRRQRVEDAVQ